MQVSATICAHGAITRNSQAVLLRVLFLEDVPVSVLCVGIALERTQNLFSPCNNVSSHRAQGYRNVLIDTAEFTTSVVVKRASREDSGEYHVVARNQWGTAEATFHVAVQGSCRNTRVKSRMQKNESSQRSANLIRKLNQFTAVFALWCSKSKQNTECFVGL